MLYFIFVFHSAHNVRSKYYAVVVGIVVTVTVTVVVLLCGSDGGGGGGSGGGDGGCRFGWCKYKVYINGAAKMTTKTTQTA